jgi:chromosome segregation ATPase
MTAITENDLKELKNLINSRFDVLEKGQKALEIGQTEIKAEIKVLDARINGLSDRIKTLETATAKIPDLAEKVRELKNWRQIVIITLTALISSAVTWSI